MYMYIFSSCVYTYMCIYILFLKLLFIGIVFEKKWKPRQIFLYKSLFAIYLEAKIIYNIRFHIRGCFDVRGCLPRVPTKRRQFRWMTELRYGYNIQQQHYRKRYRKIIFLWTNNFLITNFCHLTCPATNCLTATLNEQNYIYPVVSNVQCNCKHYIDFYNSEQFHSLDTMISRYAALLKTIAFVKRAS